MADQKISALTAASSVDPDDLLVAVDVSDTTMNASGTNKKATREIIQTYNAGTLTSDKKLLDLSGTWNAAGTTFTGLKLNVTDTASASGSLLLDVQKGGTSQLVLDKSGRLGLGTSSPGTYGKFAVLSSSGSNVVYSGSSDTAGAGRFQFANNNAVSQIAVYGTTVAGTLGGYALAGTSYIFTDSTNSNGLYLLEQSNKPMLFGTNGSERMRLDASGNLGLGVTPSAWSLTALQIKQTGIYALGRELGFVSNVFYDGAWKYIDSSTASSYVLINGTHVFLTAPTGTPGNVATFAERFNIGQSAVVFNDPGNDYDFRVEGDTDANLFFVDASTDRVGIGTNAPGEKLHLVKGNTGIRLDGAGTAASNVWIDYYIPNNGGSQTASNFAGRVYAASSGTTNYSDNSIRIAVPVGASATPVDAFMVKGGSVVINNAAIATNATDGFLYVPSCAGTPTGTPTVYTGRVPIVVDSTNNKLYFYSGGAWRDAGP